MLIAPVSMSTPAACVIEPVYRKRQKKQSENLKRVNSSNFISFVIDDIKQELLQEMKSQYEAELVKQRSREEVIAEQISIIRLQYKTMLGNLESNNQESIFISQFEINKAIELYL